MNEELIKWAWDQEVPTVYQKLALLYVAQHFDSDIGACQKTAEEMTFMTSMGRKMLPKAIDALEEFGLLVIERATNVGNRYIPQTHIYFDWEMFQEKRGEIPPGELFSTGTVEKKAESARELAQSEFERFWQTSGVKKMGRKDRALAAFKKHCGTKPKEFADMLIADVKLRLDRQQFGFRDLYGLSYLNGQRWLDDIPPPPEDEESVMSFEGD